MPYSLKCSPVTLACAAAAPTASDATPTRIAVPTLVVGVAADAEVLIRAIESGAVKKVRLIGILSSSPSDQGQSVRGIRGQLVAK